MIGPALLAAAFAGCAGGGASDDAAKAVGLADDAAESADSGAAAAGGSGSGAYGTPRTSQPHRFTPPRTSGFRRHRWRTPVRRTRVPIWRLSARSKRLMSAADLGDARDFICKALDEYDRWKISMNPNWPRSMPVRQRYEAAKYIQVIDDLAYIPSAERPSLQFALCLGAK